jgi:uncharacterized protein YcfJ
MRNVVLAVSALTLSIPALPTAALAHRSGYAHSHQAQYSRQAQYAYCRKRSGTTGLVVGGAAGALAGREIDKRGSRTTGTVLGAAVGALLGRHVERNVLSRKCRY